MTRPDRLRRAAGWGALAVLVGMALVLNLVVAPVTPGHFLPQSAWQGYSATDLAQFVTALSRAGKAGLYQAMLWVDLLFMALWATWVVRHFPGQRRLGMALSGVVVATDLIENMAIGQALGWALRDGGTPAFTPYPALVDIADPSPVTQLKLALYALVTVGLWVRVARKGG